MTNEISRRLFLALAGGVALALPPLALGEEPVPPLLDHILLGCNDLQRGIDFAEQHLGVRAEFGGVHPGRGTQNALLSLGERRYLEIIAPDPQQPGAALAKEARDLRKLTKPRLVGWAAHPGDIHALAAKLAAAGIAAEGPTPGSRQRPDGRILRWQTLTLKDNASGLLPFFIQWTADSVHPSVDAPLGCRLLRFEARSPDPKKLAKETMLLGLDVAIAQGQKAQLMARIAGPMGHVELTS